MPSSETALNGSNDVPPPLNIVIPKLEDIKAPFINWGSVQLPRDVLFLTVKDHEFLSCYFYLKNVSHSYEARVGFVYFGEIGEGKDKVKVGLMRCGKGATPVDGSINVVRNAVLCLKPKAVFCVGYCGGLNPEKAKLGDVVISAKLSTYSRKKVTKDGVQPQGIKANVSKKIGHLIRHAADGWEAPLKDQEARKVKVHRDGVVLSGPEMVDFMERQKELLKDNPEAIAIEMEGEGVYAAAFDLEIEWVVIKGISDYADGTKKSTGDWQPFASAMAASVVNNILKHPGILRDWTQPGGTNNGNSHSDYKRYTFLGVLIIAVVIALGVSVAQELIGKRQKDNPVEVPSPKHKRNAEDSLQQLLQNLAGGSNGQITYKGRTIGYMAHGRVHSFKEPWVYDGKAWDIESGISVKKKHFKESEDAIRAAVTGVIEKLEAEGKLK